MAWESCKWMLPVIVVALLPAPSPASDRPPESSDRASEGLHRVLATIGGAPIQQGEVRQELRAVLQDREPEAADDARLLDEMLAQIVRRRHALMALEAAGLAASEGKVEEALALRRTRATERGGSLEDYLRRNGIAPASYRQRVRWEISWAAYKREMLTNENLQHFFERYQRHFDGTQVRASHVLLRELDAEMGARKEEPHRDAPARGTPAADLNDRLVRARELRARIEKGEMTFAEAATHYSAAPSRDRGGDIGYFPRRGVMHEAFAAAAFQLAPGEVSPPVATPFGVHLIQVTGEKAGRKRFPDVRDEVFAAAAVQLFHDLVRRGRSSARTPDDQQDLASQRE